MPNRSKDCAMTAFAPGPAVTPDDRHAARQVLDFWFGPPTDPDHARPRKPWFVKDAAFDALIRDRFSALVEAAVAGRLAHWRHQPLDALAEIIVLDQFPRNAWRGSALAFSGDTLALACATKLVVSQSDQRLNAVQRQFAYLPFEHAEDLAAQDRAVALYATLAEGRPDMAEVLRYAHMHRDVIVRFGRFPHRNAALGRIDTVEEADYLAQPGAGF